MREKASAYERWKTELKKVLDSLVAENFERLHSSSESEYIKVWGEISRDLHRRYGLLGITSGDPKYELKRQMQHCIYINIRIYSEKEFPWELSDSRTYRFVERYGKLPKQLPEAWANFELEERVTKGDKRREQDRNFIAMLDRYAGTHPRYANATR